MDLTVFMGSALALAGAVVLLFAVVIVAYAPLAAAHDTCSSHPSDPDALGSGAANSVVCLKDSHSRLDVCDRHSDGHGVMVRVHLSSNATDDFYDRNGAAAGCEQYSAGAFPNMMAYQVCVDSEGCGPKIYGPSAVSGGHWGSGGQRPPRVSMARAIKASGVRNP